MLKVQKVYYCEYDHYTDENGQNRYNADITTDENEAREIDKDYRLASITEVEEFIGIGYDVIPVVEVQEGVYGWFEDRDINASINILNQGLRDLKLVV